MGIDVSPKQQILSVEDPPVREAGQKVESVEELVGKLKDAGLVQVNDALIWFYWFTADTVQKLCNYKMLLLNIL